MTDESIAAIVDEDEMDGMTRGRQEDLLQLGRRRFGPPSTQTETVIRSITDPDRLWRMLEALLDVSSWKEVLAVR